MKFTFLVTAILVVGFTWSQNTPGPSRPASESTIEKIGDVAQFAPAVTSLVAIWVHKDKKGLVQFGKSFGTNLAVTYALKYGINKQRPQGRRDGHAFPSGHTSIAFQGASFLQRRYGWSYGIPAYLVAGYVGYSRMEGTITQHDGWDVLGGIVVGVGSTYLFTTPYQKEHYQLTFNSEEGDFLIGINYRF